MNKIKKKRCTNTECLQCFGNCCTQSNEVYLGCSDKQTVPKYYIVSNKHTKDYTRAFWKPDSNGYTINLNEAGLYDLNDNYPLITKENLSDWAKYDTFYISIDDIELLGKKMVCILY